MLQEGLAAEMLIIWVFHPVGDDRLVRQIEGVLGLEESRDQSRLVERN